MCKNAFRVHSLLLKSQLQLSCFCRIRSRALPALRLAGKMEFKCNKADKMASNAVVWAFISHLDWTGFWKDTAHSSGLLSRQTPVWEGTNETHSHFDILNHSCKLYWYIFEKVTNAWKCNAMGGANRTWLPGSWSPSDSSRGGARTRRLEYNTWQLETIRTKHQDLIVMSFIYSVFSIFKTIFLQRKIFYTSINYKLQIISFALIHVFILLRELQATVHPPCTFLLSLHDWTSLTKRSHNIKDPWTKDREREKKKKKSETRNW